MKWYKKSISTSYGHASILLAIPENKNQKTQPEAAFSHAKAPHATAQAAARKLLYQQSPTRLLLTVVVMPWPAMSMVLVTVFSVDET